MNAGTPEGTPRRTTPAPSLASAPVSAPDVTRDPLTEILDKAIAGRTPVQREKIRRALVEIAARVESRTIPAHLVGNLPEMINSALTETDHRLAVQLDAVLHDPKVQKLEASWRGLHRLLEQARGDSVKGDEIQIRVLDAKRSEIERDLMVGVGGTTNTPLNSGLFDKIHRNAFNSYGAKPFAAIVGDFDFGYEPRDVDFLRKISYVASAVHAPFIAAAGAQMFDLDDIAKLGNSENIKNKLKGDEYLDWKTFRGEDESQYVGLCLPRVLVRKPYDGGGLAAFPYREGAEGPDSRKYLWGNAAFALAGQLVEAFVRDGWCVAICGPKGGGAVHGLPKHTFRTEKGAKKPKCPVEVQLSGDEDVALSRLGFIPLVGHADGDFAVFNKAPSCHLPARYNNAEASENAFLSAQLPYLLAASRVAHYLKVIATDDIGTMPTKQQYQDKLQGWIQQYVLDQENATEEDKRLRPLRSAEIIVNDIPGHPGVFDLRALISPHIKLESMNVTVSLVGKLGNETG